MATKKKSTTTKKSAPRKSSNKKATMKSFKLARADQPFMTFQLTRQSLYWLVLGVIVVAFTVWILKLQSDIQAIYDSIDANDALIIDEPVKTDKKNR